MLFAEYHYLKTLRNQNFQSSTPLRYYITFNTLRITQRRPEHDRLHGEACSGVLEIEAMGRGRDVVQGGDSLGGSQIRCREGTEI
jgi:hypothetical protein